MEFFNLCIRSTTKSLWYLFFNSKNTALAEEATQDAF